MKAVVLTTHGHPVVPHLLDWSKRTNKCDGHVITVVTNVDEIHAPEIVDHEVLFLVSCSDFIPRDVRMKFRACLVLHASDLPRGRGWSPHIWKILRGEHSIAVSLIEADERIDTGAIWGQTTFELEGHELFDEINEKLFSVEFDLMDYAMENFDSINPRPQVGEPGVYFRRRTQEDSRLHTEKSIGDQFNKLRVSDPARYPSFFDFRGHRYIVRIEKYKH